MAGPFGGCGHLRRYDLSAGGGHSCFAWILPLRVGDVVRGAVGLVCRGYWTCHLEQLDMEEMAETVFLDDRYVRNTRAADVDQRRQSCLADFQPDQHFCVRIAQDRQ